MGKFTEKFEYSIIVYPYWNIDEGFRFYERCDKVGEYIEVPKDVKTNFTTIPLLIEWILFIITFGYFKYYMDDLRMPSAAHDGMVNEHGWCIPIMKDSMVVRWPSWNESAYWFRLMICVRQQETLGKAPELLFTKTDLMLYPFRVLNYRRKQFFDFIIRWLCYVGVLTWGLLQ